MSKRGQIRCKKIADVDYVEIDETINHIISKCSKFGQREYKTKHNCVEKMIRWELCKKFKFDHTNKWQMHNPEVVLENETNKILRDFEIQPIF